MLLTFVRLARKQINGITHCILQLPDCNLLNSVPDLVKTSFVRLFVCLLFVFLALQPAVVVFSQPGSGL